MCVTHSPVVPVAGEWLEENSPPTRVACGWIVSHTRSRRR